MRLSNPPRSLISLLLIAVQINTVLATPFAREALRHIGFSWLQDRGSCQVPCGAQSQFCCQSTEACYTNQANVAYCSAPAGFAVNTVGSPAGVAVYTTTWTETDTITRTSTISSYFVVQPTVAPTAVPTYVASVGAPPICTTSLGESSCGPICCAGNQRCANSNNCTAYSSVYAGATSLAPVVIIGASTQPASAPVKGTSGGVSIATLTASITTTQTFLPAATASGSAFPIAISSTSSGLSGGAIAGIVIGVLAAIMLLLFICFCCILRAGFNGLLALFGLGKRRERRTETVETVEHYSRHSGGSRRDEHVGWFGGSRPTRVEEKRKKESGGFGGLGMVGAGLIGLAAVLGLKRNADKKKEARRVERSEISGSGYYSDSMTRSGTSASSASSDDRRTRRTSDSRRK